MSGSGLGRIRATASRVQIQAIALAWQVYAVARHSASVREAALAVGMLGLAQFLPMFALDPASPAMPRTFMTGGRS